MTSYPKGFVPDLRRVRPWRSLQGSLWRSPDLVRLTYGELARLVQAMVGPRPSRVLYVGPGLGHIALELARVGHDVMGVDPDGESVALARRAADGDPLRNRRGALRYENAEFPGGFKGKGPFDGVLFSRVLHHIEDPAAAVNRAVELLSDHGRVVLVEFAHDRLDRAGARWIARSRLRLSRAGWWPESTAASLEHEAERVLREWKTDHEDEGLHGLRAMLDPLRERFRLGRPSWQPYLFWDLAADMRAPPDREAAVALRLRDEEARLLGERRVRGVLFSTTGTKL